MTFKIKRFMNFSLSELEHDVEEFINKEIDFNFDSISFSNDDRWFYCHIVYWEKG